MSVNMLRVFILILFITCVSIHALPVSDDSEFELKILHTNDMHARFEETSEVSSICSKKQSKEKKCFGGFARIANVVRALKRESNNTIFLNAGDTYQGSTLFTVHKWKIVSKFLNILKPDAISLGNHEFDNGVDGLVEFINKAEFPIVTSNLDLSQEPKLRDSKLLNSTILEVEGKKIGVIGYLTPETKAIAQTDNVIFRDEIETIREEVEKLKEKNVTIFIALGHSGFEMDKKIAKEIEDIDLVIGGHTNTFLFTGGQPSSEKPDGPYPVEIVQKNGRKVYVVQAYAYTKYLGFLNIKFDKSGEIKSISGFPILLNSSFEQEKDVLDELEKNWLGPVEEMKKQVVGRTKVLLDGDSKVCRRRECSMGNFIADAMIDYNAKQFALKNGWTDTAIVLFNSGSIRSSITRDNDDKVTQADVLQVLPFGNMLMKTNMTGLKLLEVLEFSVRDLTPNPNDTSNLGGGFLQFSGIQVIYDLSREKGSRVVSVKVRCASCTVPTFGDMDTNKTYNVLVNDFLMAGGDNYAMLKNLTATNEGISIDELVIEYFKKASPVHYGTEWRINFVDLENINNTNKTVNDNNNKTNSTNVNNNIHSAGNSANSVLTLHPLMIFILLPLIKLITF